MAQDPQKSHRRQRLSDLAHRQRVVHICECIGSEKQGDTAWGPPRKGCSPLLSLSSRPYRRLGATRTGGAECASGGHRRTHGSRTCRRRQVYRYARSGFSPGHSSPMLMETSTSDRQLQVGQLYCERHTVVELATVQISRFWYRPHSSNVCKTSTLIPLS